MNFLALTDGLLGYKVVEIAEIFDLTPKNSKTYNMCFLFLLGILMYDFFFQNIKLLSKF